MGEGAGVLVLEEFENAKKRDAKIYAEIVGYGSTSDAYHITMPETSGDGILRAMHKALSTPVGDLAEIRAIKRFLGSEGKKTPISSTKSSTGHLLGAAGAVEAIFSILSMRNNIIPPTININDIMPEASDMNVALNVARESEVKYAISNSLGFGGANCVLVFKRV